MSLASPAAWGTLLLLTAGAAQGGALDPDRLAGLKARSIGPAGMSGRIAAIDAVVSDPRTVYVGAATGGLWRSANGGLTWEPLFDDQPVHSIGAVAVFQPNPSLVWVGTGEANPRNSVSIGNGVYRSLDAGKTWRHLGLEKTERIHRVLLHPSDPRVAYVCALGQAWGENPDRGVFKTEDGGESWKKVLYVDERTGCGDLAMDPANPQKLFAGLWQFRRWPWHFKSGGPGSGLHVTHDGGATWKRLQEEDGLPRGELGRIGLAISPSHPEVVYALVEAEQSVLLRSEDGGRSFQKVNERVSVAPRPFYFCDLRVDPAWPNRVYSLDYEVRVSNDGGRTFTALRGASWAQIHGDHHALWIDPGDPTRMYDGNDGGVAESRDRGQNFRFVGNLPLAQFYHVAVDGDRPYHVYGGLQDNGSWRGPSSVWQEGGVRNYQWESVGGGDGFDTQPDPRDSNVVYSMWQGGNLGRFDVRTGEWRAAKPPAPEGARLRFNWNAALAIDPFAPDTLYLGSQFVHRSTDRGETWQVISPDLTSNDPAKQKQDESGGLTPDVTAAENHTTLVAIAPSPAARGVIWTGSDDGRVHVTRDGGGSWTSVENAIAGVPAGSWVPHIRPSRLEAGTAYVVFDNHRREDFTPYAFVTEDYGAHWRSLATPDLRGYALVVEPDPVKKDLLFLGTEFGLYVSLDGGRSWTQLRKTLPTASVMDLAIHPREHDLVIATHGRALWVLDDVRPLRALSEAVLQEPLRLFEVADAQQHWKRPEEGGFGFGAAEFRGQNRPYGAILTYALNVPGLPLPDDDKERARKEAERQEKRKQPAGAEPEKDKERDEKPQVEVRVTDASGRAVRTFKAPAKLGLNRAVWDLRRDALRQLPRAEDAPPLEQEPTGPEVAPGTYTVVLSHGSHQGRQTVQVVADPRTKNDAAGWQAREQAVRRSGVLNDAAAEAIWRLRRTRDDVRLIQGKVRERAESAGEKDQKKLEELPLVKAGEALAKELTALEKRLWQSPESKGILPDTDVVSQISNASGYVTSSWDPPSPSHLAYLARAETLLQGVLAETNRMLEGEVAAYRQQAAAAGVGLLPALPPLRLGDPGN